MPRLLPRLSKELEQFRQGKFSDVDWPYQGAPAGAIPAWQVAHLDIIAQQQLAVCTELGPVEDGVWRAVVTGPEGTPYEGGKFDLELRIPEHYPFQTLNLRSIRFLTPVWSPGVKEDGRLHYIEGSPSTFYFTSFYGPAHGLIHAVLAARSVLLCDVPATESRKAQLWTQWFAGAPGAPMASLLELASWAIPTDLENPLDDVPETMWSTINDLRELRALKTFRTPPDVARLRAQRAGAQERRDKQQLKRRQAQEKREQAKVARRAAAAVRANNSMPDDDDDGAPAIEPIARRLTRGGGRRGTPREAL